MYSGSQETYSIGLWYETALHNCDPLADNWPPLASQNVKLYLGLILKQVYNLKKKLRFCIHFGLKDYYIKKGKFFS